MRIIAIGKPGKYKELIMEYEKRMRIDVIEYKENTKAEKMSEALKGYVIGLDIKGELVSSEDIAGLVKKDPTFVIGGPEGLPELEYDKRISFGRITLPHQMARLVLTEQIYRAETILKGKKYHK